MRALPKSIDLVYALIRVRQIGRKRMRVEANCEDHEATPDACWIVDDDTIYIGRWLSKKDKRISLMHELVHAALDYREAVAE